MSTPTEKPPTGFGILIKTPAVRRFTKFEGERIAILDKNGKELWTVKIPQGIDNPGIIAYSVHLDLLTEREFGHFCQKTWDHARPDQAETPPPTNPI